MPQRPVLRPQAAGTHAAFLALVGLLVAAVAGVGCFVATGPTRSSAPHIATAHAAAFRPAAMTMHTTRSAHRRVAVTTTPRVWGVAEPDLPGDPTALHQLQQTVGHRPGLIMWYVAWSLDSAFPTAQVSQVRSWGATPEITWEPWNPADGVDQPAYSLNRIAAGAYDGYLRSWARAAKAWGHPVLLRFAHEMNGSWYPWAQGVNGNGPGSYVAAWRHVHQVFAAAGATNVRWVWSPNVPYPGSTALRGLFPGDRYVDRVALDGYNWGTMQGGQWTSFADVFGPGLQQLAALSKRPVSIAEVGCPQDGGSKAAWLAGMWHTLQSWTQVRSVTWFDFDKETDWRITSSATSADAFAAGLPGYLAD